MPTASTMFRSTSSCSVRVTKLASGMHLSAAEMPNPLAQMASKPASWTSLAVDASGAPTAVTMPGLRSRSLSLVALCIARDSTKGPLRLSMTNGDERAHLQWLVSGFGQAVIEPRRERAAFDEHEAAFSPAVIGQVDLGVGPAPVILLIQPAGHLTGRPLDRAESRLEIKHHLFVSGLAAVADDHPGKCPVIRIEAHRLHFGVTQRRWTPLEIVAIHVFPGFGQGEIRRRGKGRAPDDTLKALRVIQQIAGRGDRRHEKRGEPAEADQDAECGRESHGPAYRNAGHSNMIRFRRQPRQLVEKPPSLRYNAIHFCGRTCAPGRCCFGCPLSEL